MTIRHKLWVGAGIVSLIMLGLGGLSAIGMNSMTRMNAQVHDQALMVSMFSQSATAHYFKIKGLFASAGTMDEDARDEVLEGIEEENVLFLEDLELVRSRSLDAGIEEKGSVLRRDFNIWMKENTKFLEEMPETPQPAESKLVQELTIRIENSLNALVRLATESGFVQRVQAEEQGQSLVYLMMTTTICGLFVVLGIAGFMAQLIARRLFLLEEALQHASDGDFTWRQDFAQVDEISRVGRRINEIFDSINQVVGDHVHATKRVALIASQVSGTQEQMTCFNAEQVDNTEGALDSIKAKPHSLT